MIEGATTLQGASKAIRRSKHSGYLSYGLERKRDSPSHIDPVIAGFIDELNNGRIPPISSAGERQQWIPAAVPMGAAKVAHRTRSL
jgi:hypothetical protein